MTRVLIIDDDINMTSVLEVALRDAGYDVLSANKGAQGVEIALQINPDVLLEKKVRFRS